jgi:hypothetical protein
MTWIGRRSWLVLFVVSVIAAVTTTCGGGPNAAAEAAKACRGAVPILPTQPLSDKTFGEEVDIYKRAQVFSAKAAAEDRRWEQLNNAYGTLIAAWSTEVAVVGPGYRSSDYESLTFDQRTRLVNGYDQWASPAEMAEASVRSECAVAQNSR